MVWWRGGDTYSMEYYDEDKVWQRLFSTEHRAKYIDYIRRVRSRGRVGSYW